MISRSNLDQQLKRIHFNGNGWGKSEVRELCNVLMPDEQLDECVNGFYESGFALLVATKDRLLLLDKKPLNYLIVEDVRFDMINEFDYSHRLLGAEVKISTGMKTLHFTSWHQSRLRRLLGFVQYRMTEIKKLQQSHQEAQKAHLEQMNQQLQAFLALQQYQYQQLAAQQTAQQHDTQSGLLKQSNQKHALADQIGVSAVKRVVPAISAHTRLRWMSQHRPFQASSEFSRNQQAVVWPTLAPQE